MNDSHIIKIVTDIYFEFSKDDPEDRLEDMKEALENLIQNPNTPDGYIDKLKNISDSINIFEEFPTYETIEKILYNTKK